MQQGPSTVSREIRRNGGRLRYRANRADEAAWERARRPKICKLVQNRQLAHRVAGKLKELWSPEQIAGWLQRTSPEEENSQVSHETIYRSLFIQARGALKKELLQHLRRTRGMRRSRHHTQKTADHGRIKDTVSIRERPASVEDRAVPGHWEGDLLIGAKNSQIATLVERQTRYVMLVKVSTYTASATNTLFEGDGGSGSVTITTLDGCNWSAATSAEWITLGSATPSSGNGTLEFAVSHNPSGETRTGTIAIEDTVVTLTQAWDSGPTLEIELSAESYAAGSFVEATSLRLSNTGPEAVETELWMVLAMPGDVHVSFFHMGADGSVLLPSQFSEDFGPVALFEITPDLPAGNYTLTGLVRNATTADLLSQDIKTFVVLGEGGEAGDPRNLSTDPRIQSGTPRLPKTTEGWLRSLERLAKPRGEQRKSLPVPNGHPR